MGFIKQKQQIIICVAVVIIIITCHIKKQDFSLLHNVEIDKIN